MEKKSKMLDQAAELLEKCEVLTLASVNEHGYPRICAMSKNKSDGIQTIWLSTGTNSGKTAHFLKNPKSGICFYSEGDSVTLLGNVQVIQDPAVKKERWQGWYIEHFPLGSEDPNYCILRFDSVEATCWINNCFETYQL